MLPPLSSLICKQADNPILPPPPDRNKLLFDTVCTLSDLNYDVYHAAVDCEGEGCVQVGTDRTHRSTQLAAAACLHALRSAGANKGCDWTLTFGFACANSRHFGESLHAHAAHCTHAQLYYIRPRFGDFFWDAVKATKVSLSTCNRALPTPPHAVYHAPAVAAGCLAVQWRLQLAARSFSEHCFRLNCNPPRPRSCV